MICAVCCGTKRQVEIRCPSDCVYLIAAHAHPPAAIQRQREQDLRFFARFAGGTTDRSYGLYLGVHGQLDRLRRERGLRDADAREAIGALHRTYETLGRGVIYEFRPVAPAAQAVAVELRTLLAEAQKQAPSHFERDAEEALRRTRDGLESAAKELAGESPYLEATERFLQTLTDRAQAAAPAGKGSGLIEEPGRILI